MPLVEAPYFSAVCGGSPADAKHLVEGGIGALREFILEVTQDDEIEIVSSKWMSLYK